MQVGKPLQRAFLRIECDNKVKQISSGKITRRSLKRIPSPKRENETIPKLELLAAVIGTRLGSERQTSLNIHSILQTFTGLDSKVVLCLIKILHWKTFLPVQNKRDPFQLIEGRLVLRSITDERCRHRIQGCNAQTLQSVGWRVHMVETVPPGQTPKTLIQGCSELQ
ncbi:hypothetical protein TNCT_98281 [Trichonephila clavata]|uniref:Uncharacterized protein n=1 Tax=Trichonephila clavata TaxID=2740835 RepID=A0A8X6FNC9_TRICU|nr:hypothetical protein TNCT_98281 [Trichonephila clavata]